MRLAVFGILAMVLASCVATRDANYTNIFQIAYASEAEEIGPDTYEVGFRFIILPSANRAQERESLFTGMQGALAKKGKSLGYIAMSLNTCEGSRGNRGDTYYIEGECAARMYREAQEGAILIDNVLQRAEALAAKLQSS